MTLPSTMGSEGREATAPALRVTNLSKTFNDTTVLKNADLVVETGEIHALVGENGSGKSTLIKVLAGYHQPDPGGSAEVLGQELILGSIGSARSRGLRFVHQDLGLVNTMTVLDNLMVGSVPGYPQRFGTIRRREARRRARSMLERIDLDLNLDTAVWRLPIAQQTGIAIARALQEDSERPVRVLVLDEPTAALPSDEVQHLHELVRSAAALGVGVVYVTHRLEEVFQLTDRVTVLRDGRVVGDRATSSLDHASLVDLLVGKEFPQERLVSDAAPDGPAILTVDRLDAGQATDVSFAVRRGEVLGIAGITGSGRESVLPAIFGGIGRRGGHVEVLGETVPDGDPRAAMQRGIGYLPPDRKSLAGLMELTGKENLTFTDLRAFGNSFYLSQQRETVEAKAWFDRLDVRPREAAMNQRISVLSGGNQQKVLVGKWLRWDPKVLLVDEPTQGVDIGAKAQIHSEIVDCATRGAAVVVASTDIEELVSLCHRVIVIAHGVPFAELRSHDITTNALVKTILISSAGSASSPAADTEGHSADEHH